MTKHQKRFVISAVIMLIVTLLTSQICFSTIFSDFSSVAGISIVSVVFVWVVTSSFHYWLMKTVTDKPKAFNRVFMLQATVKLLLFIAYVTICLFTIKSQHVAFVIHFFVIYLFFAIFEVSLIMKFVRENSREQSGNVDKYKNLEYDR